MTADAVPDALPEKDPLTPKQRRFVQEYLIDLNGTAAARRAGYSAKTANELAVKVKKSPHVARAIADALAERAGVTRAFIVDELAKVARANAGDYFEWGPGGLVIKASADLTEDQKAAVAEVSQTVTETGGTVRVKLHDKIAALEKLGRVLGMFTDNAGPSSAVQINISLPDGVESVLYGNKPSKDAA
ncbi:terminase small subunit [Aestuariivirga sp.]|uniref:terminase small subunit n=1 Tax=Aestuariivirga sp. TaxID=2650926 RepID=UPI003593AE2C